MKAREHLILEGSKQKNVRFKSSIKSGILLPESKLHKAMTQMDGSTQSYLGLMIVLSIGAHLSKMSAFVPILPTCKQTRTNDLGINLKNPIPGLNTRFQTPSHKF